MMRYSTYIILFIAVLASLNGCKLINPHVNALRKIEKSQFDKASFQLSQIKRDIGNTALKAYVWTLHYKNAMSPFMKLDSAVKWAHIGESVWPLTKNWEKNFINRNSDSENPFEILILEIDSLGFDYAISEANENALIHYLDNFPETRFTEEAIILRDSLAFRDAKRVNTYLSYKKFIEKYPNSTQAEAAREIYDLLLFETHTRDNHRISFENFIKKFPHSPYINEAQEKLFELYTLDYTISSFDNFIATFPNSAKADEAKLWIKHIKEDYDSINPIFLMPQKDKAVYQLINPGDTIFNMEIDSIKGHYACNPYIYPYFIYSLNGKWGLANAKGKGQIPALFHNLKKLRNDIYVYSNGFKKGLVHVSGFRITDALYDEFSVLNDTFLVVRQGANKALLSNTGKLLTSFEFDDIQNLENDVVAFKKSNRWAIQFYSNFLSWPDTPSLAFNADTVFRSQFGSLFAGEKDKYLLLNNDLDTLINSNFRIVNETEDYLQIYKDDSFYLYNRKLELIINSESEIYIDETGYAYNLDSTWQCHFFSDSFPVDQFENFNNYYKKLIISDTLYIYTKHGRFSSSNYDVIQTQVYKFIEADTFCFKVASDGKYGLINAYGESILKLEWEDVNVFDKNNIRVKKNGKYGLYNFKGESILKPEYSAISNYDKGTLTLYKENKFGLINTKKEILIKPKYKSSLKFITLKKYFFTIKVDDGLVLYDLSNKLIAKAKDIVKINDSLVFFNQDFSWKLMKLNIYNEFEELDISALRYQIWEDDLNNNYIIYETATGKGFYDVLKEENLYPEYFHIYPIVNKRGGLFLFYTFKYFEEIDLFLVKILDKEGNELYKSLITSDQAVKLSCVNLLDE